MRARIWFIFLLLCAWLSPWRSAHACSCALTQLVAPADGATDVSINTRVWFVDGSYGEPPNPPTYTLTGPQGPVPFTVGRLHGDGWGGNEILVATPGISLQPGSDYTFASDRDAVTHFHTGTARDDQAPPLPTQKQRRALAGWTMPSDCRADYRIVEADVAWLGDMLITNLTAGSDPPAAPDLGVTSLPWGAPPYVSTRHDRRLSLGASACTPWPENVDGGYLWYGTLDTSGNFSGWTSAGAVTLPTLPTLPSDAGIDAAASDGGSQQVDAADGGGAASDVSDGNGCSCALSSSPARAWLSPWVIAALLMSVRRRRRAGTTAEIMRRVG
jgi:hypothetical protein